MSVKVNSELPILIAGAGPAGLALAQGLRKRGIPFRIFEREKSITARGQGWAVAIQWTLNPLLENIPKDLPPIETVSHLHNLGLETNVEAYFQDGSKIPIPRDGKSFLRADRQKLREWLSTNIDIEWNKRIVKFEENEDSVKACFEDGTTTVGAALIGGEGAHSATRTQLVADAQLREPKFDAVMGYLTMSKTEYEEVFSKMARSVNVLQAQEVFMFQGLQHVSDDRSEALMYWMVFRPRSDDGKSFIPDHSSKPKLKELALEWTQPLPGMFKQFVEKTKADDCQGTDSFVQTWAPPETGFSSGRVTLIGDGAHKITPLGGVGVNHAFQDTFDLTELLDSEDSIQAAFKAYDVKVTKRGREAVATCQKWPFLGGQ